MSWVSQQLLALRALRAGKARRSPSCGLLNRVAWKIAMCDFLVALLASCLSSGASAHETKITEVISYGAGSISCATWLSGSEAEVQGEQWIFGYWSGSNIAAALTYRRGDVGASTDQPGIIGEIRKICLDRPSASLLAVTGEVYRRFLREGR